MAKCDKKSEAGYTLIELLVSITVFSVVVVIAMGSYLAIYRAQQRAVVHERMQTSAYTIIETIAREFRMGEVVSSTGINPRMITIENQSGERVGFRWDSDAGALYYSVNDGDETDISTNNVQVTDMTFKPSSTGQERLTVNMELSVPLVGRSGESVTVRVQDTISSRKY